MQTQKYGHTNEFRMERFPEEKLKEKLKTNSEASLSTQVLLLYYFLYYQQQLIDAKTQEAQKNIPRNPANKSETLSDILCNLEYSEDFIDSLPIQYILSHIHNSPNDFQNIYPPLLSLLISQFPHYFLTENLLSHHLTDFPSSVSLFVFFFLFFFLEKIN